MRIDLPSRRRPGSLGTGGVLVTLLILAAVWAAWRLDLTPDGLWPGAGGLRLAGEFFGRALRPALVFESGWQGAGPWGLAQQTLRAAGMTVVFAAAAVSLMVPAGLLLGLLGASSWRTGVVPTIVGVAARGVAALLRSVHELVWAVLLLAAFGMDPVVAVIAIALPYTGTLAKVFAEMLDETPREASDALILAGAHRQAGLQWGLLTRAAPDLLAYTFYRFECALRSSAVLGFFGFPTLGYHLSASFENLHYGEVWTYLYALFALVALVDWWSGRLRRELAT